MFTVVATLRLSLYFDVAARIDSTTRVTRKSSASPHCFWRLSGSSRASAERSPISESLYLTEAYDHAGRDPEIVVGIVAARGAVAEFRQHVIGLDQPEREPAAESLYVDSAADRERETRISEVTDHVVIQPEVLKPEQSVSERLNLPALSQRELRAE